MFLEVSVNKKLSYEHTCMIYHFNINSVLWQYTAGRPPLSQPPKPLIAIRSSSGFSHLLPGVFHISLWTHKTQHTQPRGWRKREKQTWTWVSSKRKKGEVCDTFALCSVHLWASASMYLSEIPSKPPGTLTHPPTLANPASESTGPSSRLSSLDCQLSPTSVDCSLLLFTASFSSSSGLVGNLACKPFMRYRTKTDKGVTVL